MSIGTGPVDEPVLLVDDRDGVRTSGQERSDSGNDMRSAQNNA